MGKATAFSNPLIVFGGRNAPGNAASDPDGGPSLFFGGTALLDSRGGYNVTKAGAVGFSCPGPICCLFAVPSTISATAIAAAQVPTAGNNLTLAAATGNGITVVSAANQPAGLYPSQSLLPVGSLVIDGFPTTIGIGLDAFVSLWNPAGLIQRAVQITSVGNDSAAFATIAGFDYGGYPVTQRLALTNAGVATTTKTFKGIYSITMSGTLSGLNVSAGQADVYGFQLLATGWELVDVYWNGVLISASTGFVAPDATSPATQLTGDTRGTYAVQSASNGTKRLVLFVQPSPATIASSPGGLNAALWGVPSV